MLRIIRVAVKSRCTAAAYSTGSGFKGRQYLSTKQQNKEQVVETDYPPENGFIRYSPYENITIPNLTIDQYVWNNFQQYETKIATVSG